MSRFSYLLAIIFCLIISLVKISASELKEGWQRDLDYEERMRITELIRGLDDSYQGRQNVVRKLIALGTGPNRQLVHTQLIAALKFVNPQVRQAAIEVMVKIGKGSKFVPPLIEMLPYEPFLDVRVKIIRTLPCFLMQNSSQRRECLELLDSEDYTMTKRTRRLLRYSSQNNGVQSLTNLRLRSKIINALIGQLDPIGKAIAGLNLKKRRLDAKVIISKLCLEELAESKAKSEDIWLRLRSASIPRELAFVSTTQQTAAKLLADLGAVEAWDGLYRLGLVKRPQAQETAVRTLAELAVFAKSIEQENKAILKGAFFTVADIKNWQNFFLLLQNAEKNREKSLAYSLMLYLPLKVKKQINKYAEQYKGEQNFIISAEQKKDIVNNLNQILLNSQICTNRKLVPAAISVPEEVTVLFSFRRQRLSKAKKFHYKRLLLELIYPGYFKSHKFYRLIGEKEKSWRIALQNNSKKTIASAFNLAKKLLEQSEVSTAVRMYAYKALGASGQKEAVPILYEWSVKRETNSALKLDICVALGSIGGLNAVKILEQLSVYKGYSSVLQKQSEEYRAVISAFQALAEIAGRKGDAGAKRAVIRLTHILSDKRALPGLPSLRKQALWQLQAAFKDGSNSLEAKYWLNIWEKHVIDKN